MSYPDVVIACIEHKVSLEAFRAIEAAMLVKHDNNMKDYFGGWTDHLNQVIIQIHGPHWLTRSLSLSESGKNCNSITAMPRN